MTIGLFPEPFNLDEVERALADDDFFSCAFVVLGIEENWRRALDQTARLITIFEDRELDYHTVYRMVSLLIQRAETFDHTGKLLDDLVEAIGMLPGTNFIQEIKMAHLHKIDPQAWQRTKNRQWVEGYMGQMKALHQISHTDESLPGQGHQPA